MTITLTYNKLDQVLQLLGFSEQERQTYKNKFIKVFFQKLGFEVLSILSDEQQTELLHLLKEKDITMDRVSNFLQIAQIDHQNQQLTHKTLGELLKKSLSNILKKVSKTKKKSLLAAIA